MSDWTLSSFHHKSYGGWAGNPAGTRPDPARCCESVHERGRGVLFYQCGKKRGYGPEQAYCKQHDPAAVQARRQKQDAKHKADMAKWSLQWAAPRMYEALCKIADGDNDPRLTAQEAIKNLRPAA